MKKNKVLKIKFKNIDLWEKDLLSLSKNKKRSIQSKDIIFFGSLNSFRNFMTLQKLEILTIIAAAKPKSVYELAKMVDRSLGPVQNDCNVLESVGFIVYEKQKTGRKSVAPKLKFNYDTIIVELPEYPYELSFKAVA